MAHTPSPSPTRRLVLRYLALAGSAASIPFTPTSGHAAAPPLMLPKPYRPGIGLDGYWVSEKYDGVRGYWDGTQLWTRGGQAIHAPAWFTADWPASPLDGELWAGHGAFATAVSTVRQQTPADAGWRQMRYMVFDLPAQGGSFDERLPVLNATLQKLGQDWVQPVAQSRTTNHAALQALLDRTVAAGGEGLVLHRGEALYRAERSDDVLKFKPYNDAEARVLSIVDGQGKFAGKMGALWVETPEGLRFKIGTGFSDAQRQHPPAIGSWLTYRYRDLNPSGIPRFASYLRQREDVAS